MVFRSDKGGEYTGEVLDAACRALGITQSMGRVASALDNAVSESFNSTLEHEVLSRQVFTTNQARRSVAEFIENYNTHRRHSACEMLPPVTWEELLHQRAFPSNGNDEAA